MIHRFTHGGALAAEETRCATQALAVQLALRSGSRDFCWQANKKRLGTVGNFSENYDLNSHFNMDLLGFKKFSPFLGGRLVELPKITRVVWSGLPTSGRCADVGRPAKLVVLGGHVGAPPLAPLLPGAGAQHGPGARIQGGSTAQKFVKRLSLHLEVPSFTVFVSMVSLNVIVLGPV